MGLRTRREQEKEKLRTRILEAATKIIAEEGYEKLSMRKIADTIEYSPTTIYNYYEDKAQIVEGILEKVYQKIIISVSEALEENRQASVDEQLELIFSTFLHAMVDQAEMGRAVIRSGSKAMFQEREEGQSSETGGVGLLRSFLVEGQRASVFRELDENISWMLLSSLIGFSMNAIENQLYLRSDWDSLVQTYVELLMKGIKKS